MLNYNISEDDRSLVILIAHRYIQRCRRAAYSSFPVPSLMDVVMDIETVHCNGTPLRLEDFYKGNNTDFTHDVNGIREHLNRRTGELVGFFLPRYAVNQTS